MSTVSRSPHWATSENVHVQLVRSSGAKWSQFVSAEARVWAKGFGFFHGDLAAGRAFAEISAALGGHREQPIDWSSVESFLRELNGCFALVIESRDAVVAAVDRLRSIPLFYGAGAGKVYVSDDAEWVRSQTGDTEPDDIAATEFLLTGYVTGQETLFPHVKQIQAGECLVIRPVASGGPPRLETHRYYRYLHGDVLAAEEGELSDVLEEMLVGVFDRLLKSTEGRTLVVPLSGGYDSRLVVAMLRRLGRRDVICFSYGFPGNWESRISRSVAEALGYPWVFVPVSPRKWHRWFAHERREAYCTFASGLASIPHIQDFGPVWELKQAKAIPDDAVFVPGHSGDFLAGSHIPGHFISKARIGPRGVARAILSEHYSLWDWRGTQEAMEPLLEPRVLALLQDPPMETPSDAARAFECWDWQERQAKFIVNACRAYEFWGFDWRIPLWDNEMLSFWGRVPLELRLGKRLYDNCLDRVVFSPLGISQPRFEGLRSSCSYWGDTVWRFGRPPYCHPWWGLRSYSELFRAYRTYRRYFGPSSPPWGDLICNTFESAFALMSVTVAARGPASDELPAALCRAAELACSIGAGAMRKARTVWGRLFPSAASEG